MKNLQSWDGDIACPVCSGSLRFDDAQVLCADCGRVYPIVDGIPALIADRTVEPSRSPNQIDFDWSSGELAEGLRCFHEQQFWQAHEHWEEVWRQLDGQEKLFLQALIQTTAGFHHLQKQNLIGMASLLRAALSKLEPLPPEFGGIAVDPLRQSLRAWINALDQQGPLTPIPFPKIL